MVNCNPETVSTDYDTCDRLYFEPLTLEDVLEVVHAERQAGPVAGVICQLGGQTPLGLAQGLEDAGVPIVGTPPGGDPPGRGARRVRPGAGRRPGCPRPSTAWPTSFDEAQAIAAEIGYPVLVRPSYVLGGRGMEIVYDDDALRGLHRAGHRDQPGAPGAGRPVHRRRGRDRRRRALRRHGPVPRRRDGAHRGGRHPLRRLGVRAAADHPRRARRSSGSARPPSAIARGRRRARPAQRAVRAGLRRALRPRGQPARQPHGAVRLQGDRDAAGQGRGPGDARRDASPTCAPRACCPPTATAATCPATRRSRSRRR